MPDYENKKKYPETAEEINVEDYHNLVLKVFNAMVQKFGVWIRKHKDDLVQVGYIGLIKAKKKYEPGRGSFLGLAYLRIMSAMQNDIAKYAKFEVHTTPLEDIKYTSGSTDRDKLSWDDMFSGDIIDYEMILRMVPGEDDRRVLYGVVEMYPYKKLRAILKETKEEHDERIARIKEELKELLEILHPNS